jgi:hypothetical protein
MKQAPRMLNPKEEEGRRDQHDLKARGLIYIYNYIISAVMELQGSDKFN